MINEQFKSFIAQWLNWNKVTSFFWNLDVLECILMYWNDRITKIISCLHYVNSNLLQRIFIFHLLLPMFPPLKGVFLDIQVYFIAVVGYMYEVWTYIIHKCKIGFHWKFIYNIQSFSINFQKNLDQFSLQNNKLN